MPRDFEVYLEDIRQAIAKIQSYTVGLTRDMLDQDDRTIDAVIRNLQIIGEAAKAIPDLYSSRIPKCRMEEDRRLARHPCAPIL